MLTISSNFLQEDEVIPFSQKSIEWRWLAFSRKFCVIHWSMGKIACKPASHNPFYTPFVETCSTHSINQSAQLQMESWDGNTITAM